MLIKTKYIDCATKQVFNGWKLPTSAADTSGDVYWSAVVYIRETGEMWTHGKLYGGFFSNVDSNKVSLTIGGAERKLALDGHVQSYTTLTGSGSTVNQAILSSGEANKWILKTLGKNAFSNEDYLLIDGTAVAAKKVEHAFTVKYNNNTAHSFDGSDDRLINIIQGDNVVVSGDAQGNITIAADPGSDTVNTAGATNLVDRKLFLIGAESQTTSPQTYSNENVYIGTDNCLYSGKKKVLTDHQTIYGLDIQTLINSVTTKVSSYDPKSAANSFTLVQGTNVTLTPDAANKRVTIASKDTTYNFFDLQFKNGAALIDTYKPTTSPTKALTAGTNVSFTLTNGEVVVASVDTRNTAGTTNRPNVKMYLVGADNQGANPQTYSNSLVFIGADNKLYSEGKVVSTGDHTHLYAGSATAGGSALQIALNPAGLSAAIYGTYGGIVQDSTSGPVNGNWYNKLKILHNNSAGYYTELAQAFTGTEGLWHRRNSIGTISSWKALIDTANFRTHLDATYVIRGNDPNVLTNYVRYSQPAGLTMNWDWGNATPTHIWGHKGGDMSKAYVFDGNNIRAFANAVNKAGDTMTGALTMGINRIKFGNDSSYLQSDSAGNVYLRAGVAGTNVTLETVDQNPKVNVGGTNYPIWTTRNLTGRRDEHSHSRIDANDTRGDANTPQSVGSGLYFDFKSNSVVNLNDGGSYIGLLTLRKYGGTTDWSGGKSAQLGVTDNSNLHIRFGSGTAWEGWQKVLTLTNFTGDQTGHTHSFANILNTIVSGNEFNFIPAGYAAGNIHINHLPMKDRTALATPLTVYYFKNGASGYAHVHANGFIKQGSNDSYALLGGGGHRLVSASSSANSIVQRDANNYIYAAYVNTAISDEDSSPLGSVYVRNTTDTWIRRMSWGTFISKVNDGHSHGLFNANFAITQDTIATSNFRSQVFGTANAGAGFRVVRWNNVPAILSGLGSYGTGLFWANSDTQGFLALNYSSAGAKIGGGSGNNIAWTANLWHSANFDPNTKVNKVGDTMAGLLIWAMNGVTSSIGNQNPSWMHFNTNAPNGFYFDKKVSVAGDVFGGTSYNRRLAYVDEILAQVGGSKSAQASWASWGTGTYDGAIQIRETGYVTTGQSTWAYAPRFTYHWGGRVVKSLGLRADGQFAVDDVPISLSTHNHTGTYWPIANGCSSAVAHYSTTGSTSGILVKIPYQWSTGSSWMISFTLRIYQSYNFYDIIYSGYNYQGNKWHSPSARLITGSGAITAKMGWGDDGFLYVWASGGQYTGATVFNVNNGYTQFNWSTGWAISDSATCPHEQWGQVLQRPLLVGETVSKSDVAAKLGRSGDVNNPMTFWWSGQGGQPTWLWGGNDSVNMYLYNPSNFSVNYANSANYANYLPTKYNGGVQVNPQTYFSSGIGLRVAMTGAPTNGFTWSDTLWINGYNGGDVPICTALHFPRDGSLEMYITKQQSTATAYGSLRARVYTDQNLPLAPLKPVPGTVIDFMVGTVNGYTARNSTYATIRDQVFDSSGRGKTSVTYSPSDYGFTKNYTVNMSDWVLIEKCIYNGDQIGTTGVYTASGYNSCAIGSKTGSNSKSLTGRQMPKHAHWFSHGRSDNANDRDVFLPSWNESHSPDGTSEAGQGGAWRTGYSGNTEAIDFRPATLFTFKIMYVPQTY